MSNLKRHVAVTHDSFMVEGNRVIHQYDDYGNHRLVWQNKKFSPWVSYRGISKLKLEAGKVLYGTSEYYASELPRVILSVADLVVPEKRDDKKSA